MRTSVPRTAAALLHTNGDTKMSGRVAQARLGGRYNNGGKIRSLPMATFGSLLLGFTG